MSKLTDQETQIAKKELVDNSYISKFPQRDKFMEDPPLHAQEFCMHSFVPAKNAIPDKNGLFGFIKCRGTFSNIDEANERAEWIIKNGDSMNAIRTSYVGKPFPLCTDYTKFVGETHEVELKKRAVEAHSDHLRKQKDEEKQDIQDIKEREKKLVEESKEDFVMDPLDKYIELCVKKANLTWAYKEAEKKMAQMQESIIKAREEISGMDNENPTFRTDYMERYMQARRDSGFPDVDPKSQDNFIKYLVEDIDLGF